MNSLCRTTLFAFTAAPPNQDAKPRLAEQACHLRIRVPRLSRSLAVGASTKMLVLALCACVIAISVSGCVRQVAVVDVPPPPALFDTTPDIVALAAAVNRTDAIRELSTNSASVDVLSMTAVPKLTANMHLQRDRNFRLKASIPIIMGSGIDLGSNADEFWFEVPEGMTQTLYHANHQQYAAHLDRAILPVDPSWMIDAIGLARLDPDTVLAGPVTRTDGMIEVRNAVSTPAGTYQRVCFIEPTAGYITHLFLYSPRGRLVAKSHATAHQYYESVNSVLPHRVKMELFPSSGPPLAMQLDVASYSVNQLLSGDPQLFAMPATRNRVDLLQMSGIVSSPPGMPASRNPVSGMTGSSSSLAGGPVSGTAGSSAWSQPVTTSAGVPTAYTASGPTGPPLRGIRYE